MSADCLALCFGRVAAVLWFAVVAFAGSLVVNATFYFYVMIGDDSVMDRLRCFMLQGMDMWKL